MNDTLVLDLPYSYSVEYKKYRSSKISKINVIEPITVELERVSSEEAPVAIEVTNNVSYSQTSEELKKKYTPNGPHVSQYRWYNGKLYLPIGLENKTVNINEDQGKFFKEKNFALGDERLVRNSEYPVETLSEEGFAPRDLVEAEFALKELEYQKCRFISDNAADRADVARKAYVDSYLVIDDEIWSTVNATAPKIKVHLSSYGEFSIVRNYTPHAFNHLFRLDQFDEAMSLLSHLPEQSKMLTTDTVEVFIKEAIQFDQKEALRKQAAEALHGVFWNSCKESGIVDALEKIGGKDFPPHKLSEAEYPIETAISDLIIAENYMLNEIYNSSYNEIIRKNIEIISKRIDDIVFADDLEDALTSIRM